LEQPTEQQMQGGIQEMVASVSHQLQGNAAKCKASWL
jgi:hypothetical protein